MTTNQSGEKAVLAELGVCPFQENVNDASMCLCGLPVLDHDVLAAHTVRRDHPAIASVLDRLASVEALANEWEADRGILSPDSRYTRDVLLRELRDALLPPGKP